MNASSDEHDCSMLIAQETNTSAAGNVKSNAQSRLSPQLVVLIRFQRQYRSATFILSVKRPQGSGHKKEGNVMPFLFEEYSSLKTV